MSAIDTILETIKNAVYGRDIRQAIHDGIKQCYEYATDDPLSDNTASAGQAPIADGAGGWAWGDVQSSGSGLTTAQKSTLMAVINAIGAFNVPNGQEVIDAFNSAWETTVESISVNPTTLTFNGVEVKTITATTVPSGEPVIWTSSDASVAEVENGQVASVGNGTCVITASSGDKSATCRVTVTGIARSYTVTNNLTNVTNSNDNSLVAEGGTYEGTLTAESGYELGTVTVIMGDTDITSTAYSDGNISIANVTGNIVITASAVKGIVTDGLVAMFDLRNAEYNNEGTGSTTKIYSTNGTQASTFTWAKNQVTSQDEYGIVPTTRVHMLSSAYDGTTQMKSAGEYTCMIMGYNVVPVPNGGAKYNNVAGTEFYAMFTDTGGSVKKSASWTSREYDIAGGNGKYNAIVIRTTATQYEVWIDGTLQHTFLASELTDFASWVCDLSFAISSSTTPKYLTCYAYYNKALSDGQILDLFDYMESMEVSA